MAPRQWITSLVIVLATAAPSLAQGNNDHRRRDDRAPAQQQDNRGQAQPRENRAQAQQPERARREQPQSQPAPQTQRAPQFERAPQAQRAPQVEQAPMRRAPQFERAPQVQRAPQVDQAPVRRAPQFEQAPQVQRAPQFERAPQVQRAPQAQQYERAVPRAVVPQRDYRTENRDYRRDYNGRYNNGRFNDRWSGDRGRYEARRYGFGAPRIIRPTIVQVLPYRPYFYRPSWSIGVYYGTGGYYPYGDTPDEYFNPIPGRYYGGLRITGAPREARVFADGYYVGIVDDFDGIFQHLNLESGPHHIEIQLDGYPPVAFDVNIRPGETITFRADPWFQPY